jgi:hypothetical protein
MLKELMPVLAKKATFSSEAPSCNIPRQSIHTFIPCIIKLLSLDHLIFHIKDKRFLKSNASVSLASGELSSTLFRRAP